jgi:hypothetical protein
MIFDLKSIKISYINKLCIQIKCSRSQLDKKISHILGPKMLPSGTNPSLALPVVDYMTYHSSSAKPTLGLELLHPVMKRFLENRQWYLMFFSKGVFAMPSHLALPPLYPALASRQNSSRYDVGFY